MSVAAVKRIAAKLLRDQGLDCLLARRYTAGTGLLNSDLVACASEAIRGTPYRAPAAVEHMRVDHSRADVPMSKKLLDRADVVAILEKVCGKGMAQCVATGLLVDPCPRHGFSDRPLEG